MPFIDIKCPQCNKIAEKARAFVIGDKKVNHLKCGHLMTEDQFNRSLPEHIISLDGKTLYPFQCNGVRFIQNSNGRCLVADEMGLGKTVQAISACFLDPKEMLPALTIAKSALKTQWQHEWMRWCGEDYFAQVIESPKDYPIPGLPAYIMSYDILRRFVVKKNKVTNSDNQTFNDNYDEPEETEKSKGKSKLIELIEKLKIKTVILDECQKIKNSDSQRTIFTRAICKHVDHVIALSGTPIKNNAAEYFPVLNILKPELFPRYSTFLSRDCDYYFNGFRYKVGGLANPEEFKRKTEDFIIRRERKEVLPDLPPIMRTYQFHELSKEVESAYIEEFKNFRDAYNAIDSSELSFVDSGNIMAYLSKMRHLTGLSKIAPCIDYVMEVMGSTEDRITIFTHHIDVADKLEEQLNYLFKEINIPNCARHVAGSAALDTEEKFSKSRVLICSTLAGGEGLNLQKSCSRFIMLERQWNPADEEQAEARFPRPEGLKVDSINGVYIVAVRTIDEFFAELVERKREIVSKTLGGEAVEWDQSSLMKELAEKLSTSGGKKWSI